MQINLQTTTWSTLYFLITLALPTDSQVYDTILTLLKLFNDGTEQVESKPSNQSKLLPEYDFIIVGGGTAGCVLANRLSEISDWKVLLLEAGSSENILMDLPIIANYLQLTPANWKYKTEPSNMYCAGLENKQCLWPRGKVLGGSSVLNLMIYTRGSQSDYDNWKALGNDGWGWQDVLPYFKKIENFNIPAQFNSKYHSKNGNLNVEYAPYRTAIGQSWVKAAKELGFKYVDYNGPEPSGVSHLQLSTKDGVRHSSNEAYLHPVISRPNLHVSKNSLVTKLIFDHTNTIVIGVEIEKDNKQLSIMASKEVIVSAGAINSPQILMLSGIGPKDNLESTKIKVIKDLPVGYNLMDHIATGGLHFVVDSPSFILENATDNLNLIFSWSNNRKSLLALPGGCEALVFMNLKDKFNTKLWPDIELLFTSIGFNVDPKNIPKIFGFDEETYANVFGPLVNSNSFMIFPILLRPKSKGRLLLQSRDPKQHPKLVPNYLAHNEDIQKIIEGIRVATEISKQPAMKKIGARIYNVPIKECLKDGNFASDAYLACQTRKFTFSIYHQSGTCKMGVEGDQTAVVDPRLKVHGIKNLRVIDASIIPEIVAAHTNAPTYMIAEKGADMIKQDWDRL